MAQTQAIEGKAPNMGVFFSPPEQYKISSFDMGFRDGQLAPFGNGKDLSKPHTLPPISPPISPEKAADKELGISEDSEDGSQDPQLFPEKSAHTHESSQPLFQSPNSYHSHKHTHRRNTIGGVSFRPTIFVRYNANPQAYIKKELEFLNAYQPLVPRLVEVEVEAIGGKKRKAGQQLGSVKRQRITKPVNAVAKLPRAKRLPRASPRETELDSFEAAHITYTAEPKAPRTTPHRDDTEYKSLVDYSPPVETLGSSGKVLKTEWRGHPLDLSNDPDRDMLHEAEVGLASTLRLSCAQYVCSKRRIFAGRLEALRNGREFRKTTAQQACKIDVNKASKLWSAFDKVGWFDQKYMTQHL